MSNPLSLFRALVVYGVCLPLAIFIGYMLATPNDPSSAATLALMLLLLAAPLFLRWHYAWMIAFWNMNAFLFFLPGRPDFALATILGSFFISILQSVLNRDLRFIAVPSVARPLIFLTVVVLATAKLTGGIQIQALGAEESMGGRRYVQLLTGIAGYFALTARPISLEKIGLYLNLYLLGPLAGAFANVVYLLTGFSYIFLVFPGDAIPLISHEAGMDPLMGTYGGAYNDERLQGVAAAATGLILAFLARYGIRGLLDLRRFWRLLFVLIAVLASLLGGFRSQFISLILTFAVLFYLEGLMRTRMLLVAGLAGVLGSAVFLPLVPRMPLSIQRSLSFLPLINVDPEAALSAQGSTEWRLEMWSYVLPQVPDHLLLGKGYGISREEAALISNMARNFNRGTEVAEGAAIAGDYHNGPLSLIMPFGLWGVFGFLWFLAAGWRVLLRNYRYGDPSRQFANRFLLASFAVRSFIFFVIFGSLYSDMLIFCGVLGLSVAINGGVRSPVPAAPVAQPFIGGRFRLAGAAR